MGPYDKEAWGPSVGFGGLAGATDMRAAAGISNKIKTEDDYLSEAYDALKLAAGLLIAHGERKRAQWVLKAMDKIADAHCA
jgi:hypothetical protein